MDKRWLGYRTIHVLLKISIYVDKEFTIITNKIEHLRSYPNLHLNNEWMIIWCNVIILYSTNLGAFSRILFSVQLTWRKWSRSGSSSVIIAPVIWRRGASVSVITSTTMSTIVATVKAASASTISTTTTTRAKLSKVYILLRSTVRGVNLCRIVMRYVSDNLLLTMLAFPYKHPVSEYGNA